MGTPPHPKTIVSSNYFLPSEEGVHLNCIYYCCPPGPVQTPTTHLEPWLLVLGRLPRHHPSNPLPGNQFGITSRLSIVEATGAPPSLPSQRRTANLRSLALGCLRI